MPAKRAARKQFEERETTLEQAEQYLILTAKMPLEALRRTGAHHFSSFYRRSTGRWLLFIGRPPR